MTINATAEVRANSHKLALKRPWMATNLLGRRFGKSKAAKGSPSGLPHVFNSRILGMELAPNGECRMKPSIRCSSFKAEGRCAAN